MFKSAKRKKSHGFTLAEVLIVVAIIGVLLAIAVPNVIGYYRSLKLTELDDSARSIFVAAQNRLTALKSAGANLYALSTVEVNEKPDPGVGTGRFLAVTSAQADSLASLVPGGSIESQLHDNHYVVEIDAKTGAVYAVWYWEKEDFDYTNESYDKVKPEKDKRLDAGRMVGYYGGTYIERPNIGQTPLPSAQMINAEELALTITVPGAGFTGTHISIKTTITLINGSEECKIIEDADLKFETLSGDYTGTIALDTLDSRKYTAANSANNFETGNMGKPFKQWVETITGSGTYKIAPGANFNIEVKVTAVDSTSGKDHVDYLPQYIYWTDVNGLFESVDEATGTAHIAYGRHLQNLDTATSGVTSSITAAEQVRDIDFGATGGEAVYSWHDTYSGGSFTAITNNNLTSYNGGTKEIRNLNAVPHSGTEQGAGLFGNVTGTLAITNTYLVDARASGSSLAAGTLVGIMDGNVKIDGCRSWLSNPEINAAGEPTVTYVSGGQYDGGFVGVVFDNKSVTITGSFASTVVNGTTGAGGLVGAIRANNGRVTVENSYAAGYLSGGHSVGGLVGGSNGSVTVTDSYAAGIIARVDGTNLQVAGITPHGNGSTIRNSYAAVRYVTSGISGATVYGVAASGATGTSAFYIEQSGVTYTTGYGDAKTSDEIKTALSSAQWSTTSGDTHAYGLTSETTGLRGKDYPYPMLFVTDSTGTPTTAVLPHHGDWLEETASASALCYYEQFGSKYQVWGYVADSAGTLNPVNTLEKGTAGSGPFATKDGYCVVVERGQTAPTEVTVTEGATTKTYSVNATALATDVTVNTAQYDLYAIDGLFNTSSGIKIDDDYYRKITVDTTDYWFNPFFACEIQTTAPADMETPQAKEGTNDLDPDKVETDNFNGKVIIRTARQLANMAKATGSNFETTDTAQQTAQKRAYVQLLDIDYALYKGTDLTVGKSSTAPQFPAALNDSGGSYVGGKFIIRNLYIGEDTTATKKGTGLFGNTKGTLSNIRLVNVSVESSSEYVGALAGRYQGSAPVTDCGVYVDETSKPSSVGGTAYEEFMVKQTDDQNSTGGLIGSVKSGTTLTNCFAAVKVSGYDEVGGLIGKISGDDSSTLTNCYSGGHTGYIDGGTYKGGEYNPADANVSGDATSGKQVGGLIGYVSGNGTVTLSGVNYSTCSVSGASGHANEIGLLIGTVENTATVDATGSTAYATGKAFDKDGNDLTPRTETPYLTTPAPSSPTGVTITAYPYDDALYVTSGGTKTAKNYPYLTGTDAAGNYLPHYGDWKE